MSYKVAILMTTYNAGAYLEQQLGSITKQSHENWILCVSDDGSSDNTLEIVSSYKERLGKDRVYTFSGPRKGFAQNFLSLVCNPEIQADYYAYCDQDDVWDQDKLEAALRRLISVDKRIPSVYGSRTTLVDEHNNFIGYSTKFLKKPSISNALVQSLAGGNTMVFNDYTRQLLAKAGVVPVISHDWWTYLVVAACSGVMIYDEVPHLRYRQHSQNLVGSNSGLHRKIIRVKRLLNGEFSEWIDRNISALELLSNYISAEQKEKIKVFNKVREGSFFIRLFAMNKTGVYRQNLLGNIGVFIGFIFRKI